jgi:cytochrome c oxidase subunit 4
MSKNKHKQAAAHGAHAHGAHDTGAAAHAQGGHGHEAHAAHGPTKSTFITIFLVLGFLTVVEVAIPQVYDAPWNQHTKMLLLVVLAVGKALLVALYFMHLKWESPWLKRIALLPAYMGGAAVLLMIETAWRKTLS